VPHRDGRGGQAENRPIRERCPCGSPSTHPLAATQKGYLIHTATEVTGGVRTVGPDYATGYGLINAAAAANCLTEAFTVPTSTRTDHLFELTLADGGVWSLDGLAPGNLKGTLVWTDSEGTASDLLDDRTSQLVNDLDLWLTDVDGTVYYPWTLDIENPIEAAVTAEASHVDIVEQVLLSSLLAGELFTIHVGHTGTLLNGLSQDFSLLISGLLLQTESVPEPGTLALAGLAVVALVARRRGRGSV